MGYLLFTCQVGLAIVLILAAAGKILGNEQFRVVLRLSYLPQGTILPIAVLAPTVEMVLALGLIWSSSSLLPLVFSATCVLFILFTLWMVTVLVRGLQLRCSCFGTGGSNVGLLTIGRNIILLMVAAVGTFFAMHTISSMPVFSFWLVTITSALGMCVILFKALQQAIPGLLLNIGQMERARAKSTS